MTLDIANSLVNTHIYIIYIYIYDIYIYIHKTIPVPPKKYASLELGASCRGHLMRGASACRTSLGPRSPGIEYKMGLKVLPWKESLWESVEIFICGLGKWFGDNVIKKGIFSGDPWRLMMAILVSSLQEWPGLAATASTRGTSNVTCVHFWKFPFNLYGWKSL